MWTLASTGLDTLQLVLGAVGASGLTGGLIAWRKLRPDMNSAAVTQSQGAVETMALLQRELERELERWKTRALTAEHENQLLALELRKCQRSAGRRSRDPS